VQGVARHWRNPVRTRVTPLDSSDALHIVLLAYTVKPMDNVVRLYAQNIVKGCKNAQVEIAMVACVKRTGLTHKCCKNAQAEPAIGARVKRSG
jgi:hypothetical protein